MSAPAIVLVAALLALYVVAAVWLTVRDGKRLPERDRILAASCEPTTHDVGPDALRLQQDLDAHLEAHFARLQDLFEELGPPPARTADGRITTAEGEL